LTNSAEAPWLQDQADTDPDDDPKEKDQGDRHERLAPGDTPKTGRQVARHHDAGADTDTTAGGEIDTDAGDTTGTGATGTTGTGSGATASGASNSKPAAVTPRCRHR
jgi:hypothetical protein